MIVTVTLNAAVDSTIEVDGLTLGGVHQGRLVTRVPSGKGVNVSRYLAHLGISSELIAFVGEDDGPFYRARLMGSRINPHLFLLPGSSRQHITLLDPRGGTETHIRQQGPTVGADDMENLRGELVTLVRPGAWIVFAGSVPSSIPLDSLVGLLSECARRGARTIVDTSGEALAIAAGAGATMIRANAAELGELMGRSMDTAEEVASGATKLLPRVATAVVSRGAMGAVWVSARGAWSACASVPQHEVRGTVGCGDALTAGLVAGLERGEGEKECLSLGVACASAATRWAGAGELVAADVQKFLGEVKVSAVP